MMKDVTMELAQILMVKVCHQGVVIFSKIPPLTRVVAYVTVSWHRVSVAITDGDKRLIFVPPIDE